MLSSPTVQNPSFEIAPHVKNTDWQALALTPESERGSWIKATEMFRKRVGRFIEPANVLMSSADKKTILYSGFAIMALDCLLIETLQSFKTGRPNPVRANDRQSTKMIVDFLTQRTLFASSFDEARARVFYDHFRNGILHQGEVKSSGRIRIDTPEMVIPSDDGQSLIVNRRRFHDALVKTVEDYINDLINGTDIELCINFIKKMNEICRLNG